MRLHDQPRDFVFFVGNDLLRKEMGKRQVGQGKLRGDAFLRRLRRQTGQHISAAQGRGPGQQLAQAGEGVAYVAETVSETHAVRPIAPSE